MTEKYTDDRLIKYEHTIRLHFDNTGELAFLTLRNYRGLFEQSNPFLPVDIVIGTPKEIGSTISIGEMLDCDQVIQFQMEVLKLSRNVGQNFISRKDMTALIAMTLTNMGCNNVQPIQGAFTANDRYFYLTTLSALQESLKEFPGAPSILEDLRDLNVVNSRERARNQFEVVELGGKKVALPNTSKRNVTASTYTAYFPRYDLAFQEERTAFAPAYGAGKTDNEDIRRLDAIFGKMGKKNDQDTKFEFHEFLQKLDKKLEESKPQAGATDKTFLHKHLARICCYALRGDGRSLRQLYEAEGFLPGVTREGIDDSDVQNFEGKTTKVLDVDNQLRLARNPHLGDRKRFKEIMRDLMHLGKYTAEQTFRGYSSATKSMAIAKSFANLWKDKADVRTYCYAVFCKGGYSLPSEVYDVELEKSNLTDEEIKQVKAYVVSKLKEEHEFSSFAEQEVAVPGAIRWNNDVVGMRAIQCNEKDGQLLSGPIFLQDRLKTLDNDAFSELFELFSGKSQGKGYGIDEQYWPPTSGRHYPRVRRSQPRPASKPLPAIPVGPPNDLPPHPPDLNGPPNDLPPHPPDLNGPPNDLPPHPPDLDGPPNDLPPHPPDLNGPPNDLPPHPPDLDGPPNYLPPSLPSHLGGPPQDLPPFLPSHLVGPKHKPKDPPSDQGAPKHKPKDPPSDQGGPKHKPKDPPSDQGGPKHKPKDPPGDQGAGPRDSTPVPPEPEGAGRRDSTPVPPEPEGAGRRDSTPVPPGPEGAGRRDSTPVPPEPEGAGRRDSTPIPPEPEGAGRRDSTPVPPGRQGGPPEDVP
ncbi:MAG: hypothetical protein WAL85_08490 [Candidatus Korobacteraceae bacterium]